MTTDADRLQTAGCRAFIALGANLGEPVQALAWAEDRIAALPATRITCRSSRWRTAPVDSSGPDYLNAVIEVRTGLAPPVLLAALHRLEHEAGRRRTVRNAPRCLDLDLLLYGDSADADCPVVRCQGPTLDLPHPRLHLRAFVLQPLAEIAPGVDVPGLGRVDDLLKALLASPDGAGQRCEPLPPEPAATPSPPLHGT